MAAREAGGGVHTGKAVINGHLCPVSELPEMELKEALVPGVTPLRLIWRQYLDRVKVYVKQSGTQITVDNMLSHRNVVHLLPYLVQ